MAAQNGFITTAQRGQYQPEFYAAVGCGLVAGMTRVAALGHATALTTATVYDLYENAPSVPLYPFLTTASALQVSSASANDTAAGSGVRTVRIVGLDANYNPLTEVVAMNGVTPVVTVGVYLRVNLFIAISAGTTTSSNAGDITLQKSGGGNILGIMRAGTGFANTAVYTVPLGFSALINSVSFSMFGATGSFNGTVAIANNGTGAMVTGLRFGINSGFPYEHELAEGLLLAQRTDVSIRVPSVSQANTEVGGGFQILLVDNLYLS